MKPTQRLSSRVHLPFSFAVGATASRFYRALRDEKTIYGTRCPACAKVSVPARSFCSQCRSSIDVDASELWVALADHGQLAGWCESPGAEGFYTALIQLQGADNLLLHRLGQCATGSLRRGMGVSAVWKDIGAGTITDIVCFRPEDNA